MSMGDNSDVVEAENGSPRKRRRLKRTLLVLAIVMAVLLAAAGVGATYLYYRFIGNVSTVKVDTKGTAAENQPINILLMGSDKRTGKGNRAYAKDSGRGGQRSDTTILLHLSADRKRALAVSIPRDTWVKMPKCANPQGQWHFDKFNSAFDFGGPACTTALVKQISGVEVNHIAVVDFGGFKQMIDALDGVEVCLNSPIDDPDSKLHLQAGKHVVRGEEALAFVRARKTLDDGSDIARIKRQQAFLSAAIRKATDTRLLFSPVTLFNVLDTATKSLTVDEAFKDPAAMREIAESMREINPKNITFVTMPFTYHADGANVDLDKAKAKPIWEAIKNDTAWPRPPTKGPDGRKVIIPPSTVWVNVINASGKKKSGDHVAAKLHGLGFQVGSVTKKGGSKTATEVLYPAGLQDSGRTAAAAASAPMNHSSNVGSVTLIVGKDWSGTLPSMVVAKPKSAQDPRTEPTRADQQICAG